MSTTADGLSLVLDRVNEATKLLQRSQTVPSEIGDLIDSFGQVLDAAPPLRLEANPYLTTKLWAAEFSAEKTLRHDNGMDHRRDVRVALAQFRHALRDISENQPHSDDTPVREVLGRTVETLAAPQNTLANLLGVSVRQLQRWLGVGGAEPTATDPARVRVLGQIVNQLRHTFTGPGVVAWFYRDHPMLGQRPIELLDDPLCFPRLLGVATAARAMTV